MIQKQAGSNSRLFLAIVRFMDFTLIIVNRSFPGNSMKFPCKIKIYLIKKYQMIFNDENSGNSTESGGKYIDGNDRIITTFARYIKEVGRIGSKCPKDFYSWPQGIAQRMRGREKDTMIWEDLMAEKELRLNMIRELEQLK